ncbi:bifunctional riboflavin kinase/FAD synthetase [Phreatobacter stygius]|uniref:Riboflavin biosynthesis protein n=1 Tax=Phreatobacter stygius TaxID=1940610 RepID=A0A4D7AX45_9HYPH|nr:bifunctional riboflavin kinase/FAD synthetase [Phreatobacter stygius]QCI65759.1 bifunctional riboflavin kinase/FAD synthetase [Phreatobacter stygius]
MPLILPPQRPSPAFPVLAQATPMPDTLAGGVIAIGNFDGVHRGHQYVIEQTVGLARRLGRKALVLTFEPHPRAFFQPDRPLFRLADGPTKIRLLAALGLDAVAIAGFDKAFAALSAEDFVTQVLVGWLKAAHVVIGQDFHYGAARAGNAQSLIEAGIVHGFDVTRMTALCDGEATVSSTAIRDALMSGRIEDANALLGHAWFISTEVIHGDKRGRTLGYPTANLRLDPNSQLAHGIYAVKLGLDGIWHDAVASFGRRPTFDNGAPLLEVHVFDFSGDLYGREVDVAFAGYIREELKFDGLDALIAQMDEDSGKARAILARR